MRPCKGQLNIKREMFNMSILKQIFIYLFFSSFETELIKKKRKKKSKIKGRMEIDGNFKNSSFMLLFSNITLNTSQSNQIK